MWRTRLGRCGAEVAAVAGRELREGRRAGARRAEREARAEAPFRTFKTTSARVRTTRGFARASPAKQPNSSSLPMNPLLSRLSPLRLAPCSNPCLLASTPQVAAKITAPVRLELTTFRLTVGRCNQLSHGALVFRYKQIILSTFRHAAPSGRLLISDYAFFVTPCVTVAHGFDGLNFIPFPSATHTTQCREECRPIKRYRLPRYRGELSNVIPLNQLLPLAKKHSVGMLERTVRGSGAR